MTFNRRMGNSFDLLFHIDSDKLLFDQFKRATKNDLKVKTFSAHARLRSILNQNYFASHGFSMKKHFECFRFCFDLRPNKSWSIN